MNKPLTDRSLFLLRSLLVFTLLGSLLACVPGGPGFTTSPERALENRAESAFAAARYTESAELWQQLALLPDTSRNSYYWLRGAEALLADGQWAQADQFARQVDGQALKSSQRIRLELLQAEIALNHGDLERAEVLLSMDPQQLEAGQRDRLLRLQSELDQLRTNPEILSINRFQNWTESDQQLNLQQSLTFLHDLDQVSAKRLGQYAAQNTVSTNLRGWLELSIALRDILFNPDPEAGNLTAWQEANPLHPANALLQDQLAGQFRQSFKAPARIAVLLPGSGRFARAGQAIRDGLVSGFLNDPRSSGSQIRFYPVSDDLASVANAYFQARDDGTDMLIGPLTRESVQSLMDIPGLSLPVLALNQIQDLSLLDLAMADQVFSFGLLPESEAGQAARQALADGLTRGVILSPVNDWGDRLAIAFREEYEAGGGRVVYQSGYDPNENDYGQVLKGMLRIDSSTSRGRTLQRLLGIPLEFESQRRSDIDMIFLAARPRQARLIKPQLKFYDAGDIPVYATTSIFTGTPDPRRDRDLNGIRLGLAPLQLDFVNRKQEDSDAIFATSRANGSLNAFFALGMDAWSILPYLDLLTHDPDFSMPGASGSLTVEVQGKVERSLVWSRFRSGLPVAIEP